MWFGLIVNTHSSFKRVLLTHFYIQIELKMGKKLKKILKPALGKGGKYNSALLIAVNDAEGIVFVQGAGKDFKDGLIAAANDNPRFKLLITSVAAEIAMEELNDMLKRIHDEDQSEAQED